MATGSTPKCHFVLGLPMLQPHPWVRDQSKALQSKVISIEGLRAKFKSLVTKCHLDVGLMERHRVYYKGEGGSFPQIQAVVSLVSPSLPMVHPSTKSAPTMH
jgi:hypothetical protein